MNPKSGQAKIPPNLRAKIRKTIDVLTPLSYYRRTIAVARVVVAIALFTLQNSFALKNSQLDFDIWLFA